MKKYDIKNTDKETLQKWFYLMTLGRALDEKGPCLPAAIARLVVSCSLRRT